MSWLTTLKDKQIVVLGAGLTGLSCLRFLHQQGLSVLVNDSRIMPLTDEGEIEKLKVKYPNAEFSFGQWQSEIIATADVVVASPGIDLEKEGISELISNNCQLLGDVELFCLVNNSLEKSMEILAVTGSNGKSTVVSLLAYLGNQLNIKTSLAGNIGEPILDLLLLDQAQQPEMVVLELSSFQLETLKSMKAIAASVLNLSDDHLDRHKTLANYQAIKQGIYPQANIAVTNREDKATVSLDIQQQVISFGLDKPSENQFGLAIVDSDSDSDSERESENGQQNYLMFGEQPLVSLAALPLAGMHNALNYMAALALGHCAGWSMTDMVNALSGFTGLAHRCQRVLTNDGIQWINDSKATNVGATIAAISGLAPTLTKQNKLILIAGGDGKGADFSPLISLFANNVSHLITLGKDGGKLAALTQKSIQVSTLAEAVEQARDIASSGDMVLLSPACASIDMFKNFIVRGEQFMAAAQNTEVVCH